MAAEPISDIIFVSNPQSRPDGYFILEKTVQGHDGQLYEVTWRHKGKRFLCFAKASSPVPGSKVVTEITIITDESKVPSGSSAITNTKDDNERTLRKHQFCMKVAPREQATNAVCDIVLINKNKGEPPPPGYFTISNAVNELNVCYRIGPVPRYQTAPMTGYQYTYSSQPHPVHPYRQQHVQHPPQQQQWYSHQQPQQPWPRQQIVTRPSFPTQAQGSVAPTGHVHPKEQPKMSILDGVPFEISPQYNLLWKKQVALPAVDQLSIEDVQNKYDYSFQVERSLVDKT